MRKKYIAFGVIACLAAGTAAAGGRSSTEEGVGVGAGAVIGAAAGGPAGAIIGAAIGAKLGDSMYRKKQRVETLSTDLDRSRDRIEKLEKNNEILVTDNIALSDDLREMQALARPELLSLLQAGIELDLLFRTDEYVLSDPTGLRLQTMAATLASMPDVYVRLDGFADERGDADYNRELSRLRAEYVRDVLVASGMPAGRIRVNAHGEAPAADDSADSYALQRKVSLTILTGESPAALASNPEK